MSVPITTPPLDFATRWKRGARIGLTIGIGGMLGSGSITVLCMGLMWLLMLTKLVAFDSPVAGRISHILIWVAHILFFPPVLYKWCTIWGLPGVVSTIDLDLAKKRRSTRSQR